MLLIKNQRIFHNILFKTVGVRSCPLIALLFSINNSFVLFNPIHFQSIQIASRSNHEESCSQF